MDKVSNKLNIIPLGGLGEIGKNMTAFRYGNDIILIDAGLMFPEDDMLGIDLVIPDITYLIENQDKLKGIFLTHGHEDHIGALPFILKQLDVPVYGTALTLGILEGRLEEAGVSTANLNVIKSGDRVRAGVLKLEFMRVNHSIPDAIGMAIHTPVGLIVHTGDFKSDQTPVDGQVMELNRSRTRSVPVIPRVKSLWGKRLITSSVMQSTVSLLPHFHPMCTVSSRFAIRPSNSDARLRLWAAAWSMLSIFP